MQERGCTAQIDSCTIRDGFLLMRLTSRPNRRFQFQKRSQHLIGANDETLSVAAMRVEEKRSVP
jgi:hypothetical protein